MADAFHWPKAAQAGKAEASLPSKEPLPAGTDLDRLRRRPAGLSLEDLKLDLSHNLYAVKPHQLLYLWGCRWRKHETYRTVDEICRALGLEAGSRLGEVEFADWTSLDLRVGRHSPAVTMGCYPQGEVPLVRLGTVED